MDEGTLLRAYGVLPGGNPPADQPEVDPAEPKRPGAPPVDPADGYRMTRRQRRVLRRLVHLPSTDIGPIVPDQAEREP